MTDPGSHGECVLTVSVGKVVKSIMSAHLFVSAPASEPTDLPSRLFLICMNNIRDHRGLKVKVKGSKVKVVRVSNLTSILNRGQFVF